MSRNPRRRSVPVATDVDIFRRLGDRVVISVLMSQAIEVEYEDANFAELACIECKNRLLKAGECTAVALRKRFSLANLLDFLSCNVLGDGLIAVHWTGAISVNGFGLQCRHPSGELHYTHVENISNPQFTSFSNRPRGRLSRPAMYIYDSYHLERAYIHEGHARISCSYRDFFGWYDE